MEPSELKLIVLERFRGELGDLRVTDIHLKRDRDHMGDPIWLIDLYIDANVPDLGRKKLYSAVSEVIGELQRRNEPAFPVFSFFPQRAAAPVTA